MLNMQLILWSLLFSSTLAIAQDAACQAGIYGDLFRFAQYNAVQVDCSRTYPQYGSAPTAATKMVTSKTNVVSTQTKTGSKVTVSAAIVTTTVFIGAAITPTTTVTTTSGLTIGLLTTTTVTTTSTAGTQTVTNADTVTIPFSIASTITAGEASTVTATPPVTVTDSLHAVTVTPLIVTNTVVVSSTSTVTVTSTGIQKRHIGEDRKWKLRRNPLPVAVKKPSKEEEFMSSLQAQGASSSAIFQTFCSCFETRGNPITVTSTIVTTGTSITVVTIAATTTTVTPTSTVTVPNQAAGTSTSTITITSTTTTVGAVTATVTSTTSPSTTIVMTVTTTPTITVAPTIITTSTVTTTPTISVTPTVSTTSTTTITATSTQVVPPAAICNNSCFYGMSVKCNTKVTNGENGHSMPATTPLSCAHACDSDFYCWTWQFNLDLTSNNCVFYDNSYEAPPIFQSTTENIASGTYDCEY